jgi:hypothetical protein
LNSYTIADVFFLILKGLISRRKLQKQVSAFRGKKRGVILYMTFATKNLKARCDVALQPLWRYVKGRHRSCDDTWSFATNGIKKETTRVVTATVAAFDVSPQGLSRNIKYRSTAMFVLFGALPLFKLGSYQ